MFDGHFIVDPCWRMRGHVPISIRVIYSTLRDLIPACWNRKLGAYLKPLGAVDRAPALTFDIAGYL